MSRDVRQALLRDAVADQLDVGLEPICLWRNVFDHNRSGRLGELAAQRVERAVQAEVLERIGAQPPRDAAHLVEAGADGLLRVCEFATNLRRSPVDGALEDQQRDGQRLTDLVVQFAGDALALVLLRRQRGRACRRPLRLEPVQHRIERRDQVVQVAGVTIVDAVAAIGRIDSPHRRGEPIQGGKTRSQQHCVRGQHDRQSHDQNRDLGELDARRHRRRRQRQDQRAEDEDQAVDQNDPPEQRGRGRSRPVHSHQSGLPRRRLSIQVESPTRNGCQTR